MRSKAIFMALLALSFMAQAVPVSRDEAKSAARAWARRGGHLGAYINPSVKTVSEEKTANGASFFKVEMSGGTVLTSGDTDIEPIIAFTSGPLDEEALAPNGPLMALLTRDLASRHRAAPSSGLSYAASAATARRAAAAARNADAWGALVAEDQAQSASLPSRGIAFAYAAATSLDEPSDLRVPALMKTQWSQADGIWNYYTPVSTRGKNKGKRAVCGCVATAAAQVMRYLHGNPDEDGVGGLEIPFPQDPVEKKTFECMVCDVKRDLTMMGGQYCWTNMPFTKEEILTEAQRKNIGKLTSDIGISVRMQYDEQTGAQAGGSGTAYSYVVDRMLDTFGYKQVSWIVAGEAVESEDSNGFQGKVLFANFDAGRPCMVGIPGHAIVADGYGFDDGLPYTHLNMGWAGSSDFWYNLPDITEVNDKYNVITEIGYNIFPEVGGVDGDGNGTHAIISGRVLDESGVIVPDCAVTIRTNNAVVVEMRTNERGIWSAILPADIKYDIEAISEDGEWIGVAEVLLEPVSADPSAPGNSWGNDLTLERPSVRVGDRVFSSIDRAVAEARNIATNDPSATPVMIEVLDTTWLKKTQTIDFPCVLVATNEDPRASAVTRVNKAMLKVATNGYLAVSNIAFEGADVTLVQVASNGVVAVSGDVDFGVRIETAAIETASADGFVLAGALERGLAVACTVAREIGDVFGGAEASVGTFDALTNSASKVVNHYDPLGEIRAFVTGGPNDYSLVWRKQVVPVEESAGYFVDADGVINTAARLDKLVEDYEQAVADGRIGDEREIVIRRDGVLTHPLAVGGDLRLAGEGDPALAVASTAGFTVTAGTLEVTGITFSNYVGNALFLVNGADAALEIGEGTVLADIEGTNKWSGAVAVLKGSAVIGGGALLDGCKATGVYSPSHAAKNSFGGAVYVASGAALALEGCTITNCHAKNFGGAVYADSGAEVYLSGKLNIVGNRSGSTSKALGDDIYLKYTSDLGARANLTITDDLSGTVGIYWGNTGNGIGNAEGMWLAGAASPAVAHASAAALFNDVEPLAAQPVDSPACLVWTAAPTGPQPWTGDPEEASARVRYVNGGIAYYLLTSEALESLTGDATVEIIGWEGNYITSDVEVKYNVTLKSDLDVGAFYFERRGDCSFKIAKGASLTLKDVTVYGCEMGEDEEGELGPADPEARTTKPIFDVAGGSLTLATPSAAQSTEIACAYGDVARNAGAVSVWQGGTFTINSGACIRDCINYGVNEDAGTGRGGAVLVDDGVANLIGGTITGCRANNGGGVFIGNRGKVNVVGDMVIDGNFRTDGVTPNNLVVYDSNRIVLTGALTGKIGFTEGTAASEEVFGSFDASFPASADKAASAANFLHDVRGDVGRAVAGGGEFLLVWSSAIARNGTYTDKNGATYAMLANANAEIAEEPEALEYVYDGTPKAGPAASVGYVVAGGTTAAVNAGTYSVTLSLRPGFSWADGTVADRSVTWTISKAVYDMAAFEAAFDGQTFEMPYSGAFQKIDEAALQALLPAGVAVAFANNGRTEIGQQTVTATFDADTVNHAAIDPMTATLDIIKGPDDPVPPSDDPDPKYAVPTNTAFASIVRNDDTWTLAVTQIVEKCWYSLYETNSLVGGFGIEGVTPVVRRQATAADVPQMTFERPAAGGQLFWKVLAEPENAHAN